MKIIYRDSSFWAVHKPAGVATYGEGSGAASAATPAAKEFLEEKHSQRLFPVHRIDADTEGLVLFALDSRAASGLIRLFKEQKVKKTYLGWCVGALPANGSIRTALKKNKSDLLESARTDFERLKTSNGFSQFRAYPFTGRFHQIRRHFAGSGNALVGDEKYGSAAAWASFFKSGAKPQLQLFAESVEFIHPVTRKLVLIKAKWNG